ncbi:Serine acetyltransferase [Sphingobium herbicidovorans NBRC 16415]|jgi:serine O-acetyltransferase|uniref:serine O-acetyltransferase n=1 Tax=Sphingobium herbicidovorans (strain ATCC 700291 / DSM 11019 / CCUG 56400 / KCTC 2939 / LMG 18315 / NBRC 16415 / MH) TaxID=1219045 RepID=A0A086PF12_SPHHM|nr:serine O-acetyltransferase EpsC [Sphingobium herbicidovorans]KFG91980.1 Serine acetyltransferase [Sphingobium herbicidovorans NBRC 16415]
MTDGEGEDQVLDGYWDIGRLVSDLGAVRSRWRQAQQHHAEYGAEGFPSRASLMKITHALCGALFPLRLGPNTIRVHNEDAFVAETLQTALSRLYRQIRLELLYAMHDRAPAEIDAEAARIIGAFAESLPSVRELLDSDVEAAFLGDPAARSMDEVLICYPSMLAIIHHRLAHRLYDLGAPLVARITSEIAHSQTGIDIHPGARIGHSFFIDHGTGVVIGETAIVGNRVRLYQGVTLGARSFPADEKGALEKALPRHPIIEDDVVIYAGATILGRIIIGSRSVIGGNVWLTDSVPADSNVRQAKAQYEVTSRVEVSAPHRVHGLRDGFAENI